MWWLSAIKVVAETASVVGRVVSDLIPVEGQEGDEKGYKAGDLVWSQTPANSPNSAILVKNTGEEEWAVLFEQATPDSTVLMYDILEPGQETDVTQAAYELSEGQVSMVRTVPGQELDATTGGLRYLSFAAKMVSVGATLAMTGGIKMVVEPTDRGGYQVILKTPDNQKREFKATLKDSTGSEATIEGKVEPKDGHLGAEYDTVFAVPAGVAFPAGVIAEVQADIVIQKAEYDKLVAECRKTKGLKVVRA